MADKTSHEILEKLLFGDVVSVPHIDLKDSGFLYGGTYYGGRFLPDEWRSSRAVRVSGEMETVAFCLASASQPEQRLTYHDLVLVHDIAVKLSVVSQPDPSITPAYKIYTEDSGTSLVCIIVGVSVNLDPEQVANLIADVYGERCLASSSLAVPITKLFNIECNSEKLSPIDKTSYSFEFATSFSLPPLFIPNIKS